MKLVKDNTLPECLQGIARHRTHEAYAIIGQGLWLLKAAAIHSRPADSRGQGRKSTATIAVDSAEAKSGFEQWLLDNVSGPECSPKISMRTCYNYMQAAAALGLTADSDEDDLLALQEANALGARRISDLYKPVLEAGAKDPPRVAPPLDPIDYWDGFKRSLVEQFADESKNVIALYQLPRAEVDLIETQLRAALDTVRQVKADLAAGKSKSK